MGGLLWHSVHQTKVYCEVALRRDTFQRGDYKYLCQLVAFFLGAEVPNFQFLQPGAHHQARFMADCLYLLAMQMTSPLNPNLSKDNLDILERSTDFIVFFHAAYFLKSPLAAQAPGNDLSAFKLALQLISDRTYQPKYGEIAKALHKSLIRHSWYLSPQTVIFALVDEDQEEEEKKAILDKLLEYECPKLEDFDLEQPEPPTQVCALSSLADFVTEQSYLFLIYMGFTKEDVVSWKESGSDTFCDFAIAVKQLAVVNDRAERHIRLVQDFIGLTHHEDSLQDTMQVVLKNRQDICKYFFPLFCPIFTVFTIKSDCFNNFMCQFNVLIVQK